MYIDHFSLIRLQQIRGNQPQESRQYNKIYVLSPQNGQNFLSLVELFPLKYYPFNIK